MLQWYDFLFSNLKLVCATHIYSIVVVKQSLEVQSGRNWSSTYKLVNFCCVEQAAFGTVEKEGYKESASSRKDQKGC